jgi:DNA-binding transcriptional regulator YiaG
MTPAQIQSLRHALGESTDEFGQRFLSTGRAVENWEQGHRAPHPLVQREIRLLAEKTRVKKTSKKS